MLVLWSSAKSRTFKSVLDPVLKGHGDIIREITPTVRKLHPGDVCLAYGAKAFKILQQRGLAPRNRAYGSMRGQLIKYTAGGNPSPIFMTSHDPGLTYMDYATRAQVQWDTRLAIRLVRTGSLEPVLGDYRYVPDFSEIIHRAKEIYGETGRKVPVSVDLETVSLDPYDPDAWIVSISVTVERGRSHVIYFSGHDDQPRQSWDPMDRRYHIWRQIQWILNSETLATRGANFKYDLGWMWEKWGIECTNFTFDTLLVGSLMDENRTNSLNMHSKIFTQLGGYDDSFNRKHDKSRMHLVPKGELLPYAGGDTDACWRTARAMKSTMIQDKQMATLYKHLVHPVARVYEKVERRGVCIDIPYYEKLKRDLEAYIRAAETRVFGMLPHRLTLKYADNLSIDRDNLLIDFLFTKQGLNLKPKMLTKKTEQPSVAKEHLDMFLDVPEAAEFVKSLSDLRQAKKTYGTYVVGFMEHIRADSKFHPVYFMFKGVGEIREQEKEGGTNTGRVSAKDPAWQTIPKRTKWTKKLRKAFIAPPGYSILNLDYSQGELRMTACVAEESTMLEAYLGKMDLHAITAAELNGYRLEDFLNMADKEEKSKLRDKAKCFNFGLIYGMMAKGFVKYAWKEYGIRMTEEDAQESIDKFFGLYSGLPAWHEKYRELAHRDGYVVSPIGRVRHLPLINSFNYESVSRAERQAVNSPIQGTLADLTHLSMIELDRRYPDLWMFGTTHDNISMYVPEGTEREWAIEAVEVMENLPLKEKFDWEPQLTFVADAGTGPNLAELNEIG